MHLTRLLVATLVLLFVSGAAGAGEPLTDAEREALLAHLDRTKAMLVEAVDGLTPEQWAFKPAPDRWSIAENVEHLVLTEPMLRGMTEQAMQESADAERLARGRQEEKVLQLIVDRSTKVKTFEPLEPTGRWATQSEALEAFFAEREKTRKLAAEGGDLRAHVTANPVVKDLDAYGNLLFVSGHVERHVQQIEEVKTSEGYPR